MLFSLLAKEFSFFKLDFRALRNCLMRKFPDEKCLSEQQLAQDNLAHKRGLGLDAKGSYSFSFSGSVSRSYCRCPEVRCDSVSLISTSISVPESHW